MALEGNKAKAKVASRTMLSRGECDTRNVYTKKVRSNVTRKILHSVIFRLIMSQASEN